jgi:hypothetical protein
MSKAKVKIRRQKAIPGGRDSMPACVIKEILDCVRRESLRYNVSKSFVVATIVADFFGIEAQEHYITFKEKHQIRRVK